MSFGEVRVATVMQQSDFAPVRRSGRTSYGKIVLWVLLVWYIGVPAIGMFYGRQVNTQDWFWLTNMPAAQQEEIQVRYFSDAAFNFVAGGIVWVAGMIFFGMLVYRSRPRD
jgi:ABC-type Fe3+ transport system permease subunit